MNTLQAYLRASLDSGVENLALHIWKDTKGNVGFTLQPDEGPAYWVSNDTLIPAQSGDDKRILPYVEAVLAWARGL